MDKSQSRWNKCAMSSGAASQVEVMVVEVERLQSSSTVKCEGPYGNVMTYKCERQFFDVGEDSRVRDATTG
jgi:hypothetical protein